MSQCYLKSSDASSNLETARGSISFAAGASGESTTVTLPFVPTAIYISIPARESGYASAYIKGIDEPKLSLTLYASLTITNNVLVFTHEEDGAIALSWLAFGI